VDVTLMPRHRLLAAICAVAVLALAWAVPGAAATAQPATPIRHVVVIDLENHSFDNVLGFWCDAHPGRCPDGGMPASVRLSNGAVVTPYVMPDTVPNINHTVASQLAAMHIVGGVPLMDGWQNIKQGGCGPATSPPYACIGGYAPGQIPNITGLATKFAISDTTFSMADSPSWGGHLYPAMASLDSFTGDNPVPAAGVTSGPGWGCDSDKVTTWLAPGGTLETVPSCIPDNALHLPHGGAFKNTPAAYQPTIFDRLAAAGLSWKIYGPASSSDGGYDWAICPSLAECQYTAQRTNLVEPTQFFTDAAAGELPAFSIVTAGGAGNLTLSSCHNKFSMTACDNYVGRLVSAAEHSPDWSSTAVFITWDDCGCFYDQVPPGVNPDGTRQGPRVPLIIVSPYAKPGYSDTTATTFAGILAYTEGTFRLSPLGPNDMHAYSFTNAFNYAQAPLQPIKMITRPLPASARRIHLTPALLNDPS
jgi:phospholipase C